MTLIKSISGIRGTIGGEYNKALTPIDVVELVSAFSYQIKNIYKRKVKIAIGRDARTTGKSISNLAINTMVSMGIDVVDLDMCPTPSVSYYVFKKNVDAGIIVTASHNPKNWNALKFIDANGEIINKNLGNDIINTPSSKICFSEHDKYGNVTKDKNVIGFHIEGILNNNFVDVDKIKKSNISVAFDAVNSIGGPSVSFLLKKLGVKNVFSINETPSGNFAHNPEPLPENLFQLCSSVVENKCDVGFIVDPDVDRLAIVQENGNVFGEEYTIVSLADYILEQKKGNVVSNLSSSRAMTDVAEKYKVKHYKSSVGELNVVQKMKKTNAVFGGEGSGGVIMPDFHYGRDALVGIALFLSFMANKKLKCSEVKKRYKQYYMSKTKIELSDGFDFNKIKLKLEQDYDYKQINTEDGIRMDFEKEWIQLRLSNTEPIMRIYAESVSKEKVNLLVQNIKSFLKNNNLL